MAADWSQIAGGSRRIRRLAQYNAPRSIRPSGARRLQPLPSSTSMERTYVLLESIRSPSETPLGLAPLLARLPDTGVPGDLERYFKIAIRPVTTPPAVSTR